MIQDRSLVVVADNSGAKIGRVFKIPGSSHKRYAQIGEIVVLSVQTAEPRKAVKMKDILKGIVVRQRQPLFIKRNIIQGKKSLAGKTVIV